MLFNFSLNMSTFRNSKNKNQLFYHNDLNKGLSDVMEHHISVRKASKVNFID